jgi:hypothetical protein
VNDPRANALEMPMLGGVNGDRDPRATGQEEIWTDWTGAELGSSPAYLQLDDVVNTLLPHETIAIRASPTWPAIWLGLTNA